MITRLHAQVRRSVLLGIENLEIVSRATHIEMHRAELLAARGLAA